MLSFVVKLFVLGSTWAFSWIVGPLLSLNLVAISVVVWLLLKGYARERIRLFIAFKFVEQR